MARKHLLPGDEAPDFKCRAAIWCQDDIEEIEIKLEDFEGRYLVLLFYPQDFTFICPTEVIAFGNRASEFDKIDCSVIACSTDSLACHRAWMRSPRMHGGVGHIGMPLLADTNQAMAKAYQVLKEDEGVAFRAQFIIDGKGIIRHIMINDFSVGRNVDETLRIVKGFQHFESHGEVCPVNWKPGKKTFRPSFIEAENFLKGSFES